MPSADTHRANGATATSSSSKPFSISIGSRAPAATTPKKRPHSALANDSDSDSDNYKNAGPQLLSGIDRSTGRAIAANEPEAKQPLVITRQKNQDWRAEAAKRKGKNLLPAEEQARRAGKHVQEQVEVDAEKKPAYGLLVAQKSAEERSNGSAYDAATATRGEAKTKTVDEEALEALLGDGKKSSTLVIEHASAPDDPFAGRAGDGNAFKADVNSRPDVPSLSDYAAVPIEEFGKALMRGMGWKEGDELGRSKGAASKPREAKMRPALLGIGAKEVPDGVEELGSWGKGAKKSRRIDRSYMPLVMENTKTGEKLTEDELEKKRQHDKMIQEDGDDRRNRSERKAIKISESRSEQPHRDRDDRGDRDDRNGTRSHRGERERDHPSSRRHRDDEWRSSERDRKSHRSDHESDKRREGDHDSRQHKHKDRRRRQGEERPERDHDGDRRPRRRDEDRRR